MDDTVQWRSEGGKNTIYKQFLRQFLHWDLFYGQFVYFYEFQWQHESGNSCTKLFASLCKSNSDTAGQEKLQACKSLVFGDVSFLSE